MNGPHPDERSPNLPLHRFGETARVRGAWFLICLAGKFSVITLTSLGPGSGQNQRRSSYQGNPQRLAPTSLRIPCVMPRRSPPLRLLPPSIGDPPQCLCSAPLLISVPGNLSGEITVLSPSKTASNRRPVCLAWLCGVVAVPRPGRMGSQRRTLHYTNHLSSFVPSDRDHFFPPRWRSRPPPPDRLLDWHVPRAKQADRPGSKTRPDAPARDGRVASLIGSRHCETRGMIRQKAIWAIVVTHD